MPCGQLWTDGHLEMKKAGQTPCLTCCFQYPQLDSNQRPSAPELDHPPSYTTIYLRFCFSAVHEVSFSFLHFPCASWTDVDSYTTSFRRFDAAIVALVVSGLM